MLKREDLQQVFSFKIRGAYNKMRHLTPEQMKTGVICCSAGNHSAGVAMSAKALQIHSTIVMPVATPLIKVANVKRIGQEYVTVIMKGNDFDEAQQECMRIQKQTGMVLVHPFDDPLVIAGQGTIGLEVMKQAQQVDIIFVCVGGGGMLAGVVSYIKRIHPHVKVYGVETFDANSMELSLKAGHPVQLDTVGLFADGAAVRKVGQETFRVCKGSSTFDGVDGIILVSNDEICAAIKDVFVDTRSILEPAGALGVAGMKKYLHSVDTDKKLNVVAICSGANMQFDRLRFVAERASLGEEVEALFSVTIPEKPGSFIKLYEQFHPRDITEISYRYNDPLKAQVVLSCRLLRSLPRQQEVDMIADSLLKYGMILKDLSYNEVAKTHLRYMVGQSSKGIQERIVQFSFPERPLALKKFLECLRTDWNVSLTHYRNYGGDIGKVLVGIQLPSGQEAQFETFLIDVGYPYIDVTDDPALALIR